MYGSRYQKNKPPYGLIFALLCLLLLAGYCVSGMCRIPGANIRNLPENLMYVFRHPFSNWNEKTPAFLMMTFLVWLMLVSYILYYFRDFHSNEHGDEDWLDAGKASQELADKDEKYNRILSENVKVSLRSGLSNNNALVIGSSGSYKTTSLMHQNMLQYGSCYVVLDVKGDTQRKLGRAMQEKGGYTIRTLNFKQPEKSDRYNPFVYIEREDDLLRVIKALHDACRPPAGANTSDPFWDDGVNLYLQALFYYVWLDGRERETVGTMNDITWLCNQEMQRQVDPETEEETTALQRLMEEKEAQYGPDYPPVRDYKKLKEGAPDTVRSIVIMVNAMLAICETGEVKRIFSANDIDIRELGTGVGGDREKKVVLFLVIPDNNSVYNWIVSMFYTQMFDILIRLSDDELRAPLPIPVEVWMDEFYAGAKPAAADVLLGVVRSRNISMIPILQSVSQIKTLFQDDKWETIMDNVAAVVYLGSGPMATATHKWISDALGEATIDSRSDNVHQGMNGSSGLNFSRAAQKLMTPGQVKRMPTTECIIFLESRPPIYDTKAIPFDQPAKGFKATSFLKGRYKAALSLGAYEHPVYTLYDPVHFTYITVEREVPFKVLTDANDIRTYTEAAKRDPDIYLYNVEEKDLLYLSWGEPRRSQEDVEKLMASAMAAEQKQIRDIQGLAVLQDVDLSDLPYLPGAGAGASGRTDKSEWDRHASLRDLLAAHWDDLTSPEQEEICLGMEDGLTEEQLCRLVLLPLEEMTARRRAYTLENASMQG